MYTRTLAIVIVVVGIAMMVYNGFNFVTNEKVVNLGTIKISQEKNHPVQWSPVVGIVLLVGGLVIIVRDKRKTV